MSITTRLNNLEKAAAATVPRTVAQLVRDFEAFAARTAGNHRAWFARLSDAELRLLCAECDRQFPQLDFGQFTSTELDQIMDLNADEVGQLIAGDLSVLRGYSDFQK